MLSAETPRDATPKPIDVSAELGYHAWVQAVWNGFAQDIFPDEPYFRELRAVVMDPDVIQNMAAVDKQAHLSESALRKHENYLKEKLGCLVLGGQDLESLVQGHDAEDTNLQLFFRFTDSLFQALNAGNRQRMNNETFPLLFAFYKEIKAEFDFREGLVHR